MNITIEFCMFELGYVPNFKMNLQFSFFWTKFAQNRYFHFETKSEHHHWILHTWLSLGATFQLKLTILIFGPNFLNKYAVYLFGICCIKFTSRSNIFTENPKTLEILPFYQLYTNSWPKISEISEWIQKNVSGEKRQFQYVLLK